MHTNTLYYYRVISYALLNLKLSITVCEFSRLLVINCADIIAVYKYIKHYSLIDDH